MEIRMLGKTNIEVSKLCFGTLTLGPLQAKLSLSDGAELICYAINSGITFFDTAQLYETYSYLKEGMKKANKYDIVISSKTYADTKELAQKAVEQARRELDRDYIDIFMLHEQESIHTLRGHNRALEYLYECKQKGIIKAVGASMHHIAAVRGAVEQGLDVIHPMINKNGLGIVDGGIDEMLFEVEKASDMGIGVFSMKALGGGNLFSDASSCLNFVLEKPFIDSVAIGMQSTDEIDANISFFETGHFDDISKQKLSQKDRKINIDDWCCGCGQCVARCTQGAMEVINSKAFCDKKKCVLCGYCSSVCPEWAIKII